jgi:hypothetical protein
MHVRALGVSKSAGATGFDCPCQAERRSYVGSIEILTTPLPF